jgi:hypothetical protein
MQLQNELTDAQIELICNKTGLTDKEWLKWIYSNIVEVVKIPVTEYKTDEDYRQMRKNYLKFVKEAGII